MKRTITIPGKPKGKGRPRVTKYGTYTPQATKDAEANIIREYRHRYGDEKLEGAIRVDIVCRFPLAKKDYDKYGQFKPSGIEKLSRGGIDIRIDCDNMAKLVLDALNGVAYEDDKQVVSLSVTKFYDNFAETIITLEEINHENLL